MCHDWPMRRFPLNVIIRTRRRGKAYLECLQVRQV
jgi:hypothetical protein